MGHKKKSSEDCTGLQRGACYKLLHMPPESHVVPMNVPVFQTVLVGCAV